MNVPGLMVVVETWRPCAGFEAWYEVSSRGRIRRRVAAGKPAPKVLSPFHKQRRDEPYLYVAMVIEGKKKLRPAHRLILETYVGPRPAGHEVAFRDGNVTHLHPDNLFWRHQRDNPRRWVRGQSPAIRREGDSRDAAPHQTRVD